MKPVFADPRIGHLRERTTNYESDTVVADLRVGHLPDLTAKPE
jgi:hypothetical protein